MKIVSLASEMTPYAKTGGLAEVSGTLTRELKALGHEVLAFLPAYKCIGLDQYDFETVIERMEVPLGGDKEIAKVHHLVDEKGVHIYLIDHEQFFARDQLYGTTASDYPDNDRRFIFFQRAALEVLRRIGYAPDIIHCHDWQTGLVPVYLKTLYAREPFFKKTRSVFTIHNLGYQGNFPPDSLPLTGLGWEEFKMEKLEFYGKISFLKGGLVYSDALTTVSSRYAQEIQTKEFGCGMESVIATRSGRLFGVVNGIDYEEWNPQTDPDLKQNYGADSIEKKAENKKILQAEHEFKVDPKIPVIGLISRLVDQKGIDILIPALDEFEKLGVQFVLLGTGDEKYHKLLRQLGKKYKQQFGIHIVFDTKLAKKIYAGCDLFLLPSYYEPCGLGQMIAVRYGTVPVVRATGGLADTIQEFDPKTGKGNGFLFEEYTTEALLRSVKKALKTFEDKKHWKTLAVNAMNCDFSWTASAKKYAEIFELAVSGKIKSAGK